MKITCQACQSKYTIADDKIQGKVAKIRCRKCGATVLVDASTGGTKRSNGSAAAIAAAEVWLVSVADGDQRTMKLAEVLDAYNSGTITGDTYLWKEGFGDWQPLSEIEEIVAALNEASEAAGQAHPSADYGAPPDYSPAVNVAPQGAARRDTGRGRGDLFGGGMAAEEEVATSAPAHVLARGGASAYGGTNDTSAQRSGLTGARDEQSVLFSLSALTGGGPSKAMPAPPASASYSPSPAGSARNDDSGLIDLNALARAQEAARAAEPAAAPMAAPTPFMFPAALGTAEVFHIPEQPKKSSMPLVLGGGIAAAGIAIAIAIFAGKKEEAPPPPPVVTAPAVTAEPASATPPAPTESAAAPASSAPSAKAAPKGKGGSGAGKAKASGGDKGGPGPVAPATPPPLPKAKSPCGCSAGDLQCQIRCSAVGH